LCCLAATARLRCSLYAIILRANLDVLGFSVRTPTPLMLLDQKHQGVLLQFELQWLWMRNLLPYHVADYL